MMATYLVLEVGRRRERDGREPEVLRRGVLGGGEGDRVRGVPVPKLRKRSDEEDILRTRCQCEIEEERRDIPRRRRSSRSR